MIHPALQLLLLALLFVLVLRLTPARWLRAVLAVLFALVLATEAVVFYLSGNFFNYQAYIHTNLEAIQTFGAALIKQAALGMALCAALAFVLYTLGTARRRLPQRKVIILPLCLLIALLLTPRIAGEGSIVGELHQIYKIKTAGNASFTDTLRALGIDPQDYPTGDQITAEAGKNIIVIPLESLEGTYFTQFPGLLPNLERLAKEWTFYDMLYSPSTAWSAAALYAQNVGMPGYFKENWNDLFQHTREARLTGLGNVLRAAGYDMKAVMKIKDLAGKGDILQAYGIETIDGSNSIGQYKDFHDLDLFQEARLQIERFTQSDRPFALFLFTLNTHFPNGIYDARMKQFIDREDDGMEFAAASIDYLIGDFIQYLQDRGLLENTVIYLFPDHMLTAGGSHPYDVFVHAQRSMYMITNAPAEKFGKPSGQSIHPIDLPKMILQGADVRSNARFLVDFIPAGEDINTYLANNREKLTALNSSALHRENYQDGFKVMYENGLLTLQSLRGHPQEVVETGEVKNALYDFRFTENMVPLGHEHVPLKDGIAPDEEARQHHYLHVQVNITDGQISEVYFGNKNNLGTIRTSDNFTFDKAAVQEITDSLHRLAQFEDPAMQQLPKGHLRVISSSWEETQNGNPTRVILGQKYLPFAANRRGVNLLSRDTDGNYQIENFDWFDDPSPAHALLARMRALQQCRQPFILVGDDAILRHPAELDEEFVRMGLYKLVPINGRAAYLAYSNAQGVVSGERTAPDTVSIDIDELPRLDPCPALTQAPAAN